jgi:UDP-N-acetylglucosamine 2-epimerase (non-hydrolysing)
LSRRVVCVVGTRPEAIKMAPVIRRLKDDGRFDVRVLATAQHRHLLDQVLCAFGIEPDIDLDVMRPNQALNTLAARLLLDFDEVLQAERPDAVLAQGDTTTVMTAALACFHLRIPFGHVEAGLRTGDLGNPFPEELNRVVAGRLAAWHFAPTESARANLLREGVADGSILVSGNTVIDALLAVAGSTPALAQPIEPGRRLVLMTMHRRENFGAPMRSICAAVNRLTAANPDLRVLFPVHPNPNVRAVVDEALGGNRAVIRTEPLEYVQFIAAMQRATLVLSDSGGVQEEAPALGKPVLVLRTETERPEAIAAGVAKLVGFDADRVAAEVQRLLDDPAAYAAMARGVSPYGDGRAAERIVEFLGARLA